MINVSKQDDQGAKCTLTACRIGDIEETPPANFRDLQYTSDFTMLPDPKTQFPHYRKNRRGRNFSAAATIFGRFCEICANAVRI